MLRVAAAIVTFDGKILFFLRDNNPDIPDPNCWSLIGGHVEENETYDQGLKRELKEEIGIDISEYKFLFEFKGFQDENVKIYHVPLTQTQAKEIRLGDEGQKVEFMTIDQIDKLPLTQNLRKLFQNYRRYFEEAVSNQ